ncbi:prolyl oligopeptidase family serine peptidase [Halomicroarcula sp. S1AR25-4]|uniref:S9 family peptidase n=1 Tax=Haloarcula sp. S1AR25-4 TaxID=2950538 RepID=UPI0028740C96|nr:prolyl oligopeptidase family serine peptidase [Halomicroarcula sp. S1AR25-4]MDS0277805.1 prolyl oligopeptidase family serine peptidase [Halomicroarcula sp. S1AR25-4]
MSDPDSSETLEALASLPTLAHPTASPDGESVALYYDGTGRNELHVLDPDSGESEQWSDGEVPRNARWHVEWSADGERVFFHLDDAGDEQNDVYAIDRDGTVEPVVEMDGQVVVQDVGADGETLLVGSTRDGQMNLYAHDLSSGETAKLTDYERAVWTGLLSPDGDRVAYTTNEADDFENMDVYLADADGSNPRTLGVGETGAEAAPVDWGPDGDRLLVSDNSADLTRAGVYDLETDEVAWFGGEFEEEPHGFTPDGERFLATRTREAAKMPVVYDVDSGEARELDLPEGVATFAGDSTLADGRVLLIHTTPTHRPDLLAYDLAADEYETLHEAEYGPFSPEDFAEAEFFTVASDGVPETRQAAVEHDPYETLDVGALLYDSGERPSPLVVNPHGGPRAMDTKSFGLYTQFLVQRGFSVLQVNYRGSTGRGREFVQRLYDDWGGAEQGDVATAAEHVLDTREWVDDERVAVFGGSYGGYSAYWQLVQYPDLYDAGVAWIGLTDLEDQYENTMPHYRTELMEKNIGTPEDNPDLYRERSPVEYVENLSAPLFVLHGVNDRRVPVSQARLFRDALDDVGYTEGAESARGDGSAVGGDYEYEELGEEGHASSDIDQKIRLFELLDDFLDRRIGTEAVAADD